MPRSKIFQHIIIYRNNFHCTGVISIKRFLIIDGHSLIYRGFHAINIRLTAPDGTLTTAIVGFMNMMYYVQDKIQPDCTVSVFDAKGKTFRHEIYSGYKKGRFHFSDDLAGQITILQELLRLCGIRVIIRKGVEADDTVASAVKIACRKGYEVFVLSSDKDLLQILDDGVYVIRPTNKGVRKADIYTEQSFTYEYGFPPSSMPDYLAIVGDKADNIKGVHGIGDKGAKKILSQYPTIEDIYSSLNELTKTQRENFTACGMDAVIWTRDNLTKLRDDIFDNDTGFLDDCLNMKLDFYAAEKLALRLGLLRVLRRIGSSKGILPSEFPYYYYDRYMLPQSEIITLDYKTELLLNPERFSHSLEVWDLKTAYYLLHPDKDAEKFIDLFLALEKKDADCELNTAAGYMNAEIHSYDGLQKVMTDIDLPLIPVLDKMEAHGLRIDRKIFAAVQAELSERIAEIEHRLSYITGFKINLNSPFQVSWLLFDKLNFPPSAKTKSKTSYSTEAGVLEKLAKSSNSEVPSLILEHRELSKMLTSFVLSFQKFANSDGMIHTTFEPAMTGTGRLSSREPNIQNIPAFGEWAVKIKSGIIPVNPENIFVSADYSQAELRILAHISQEERLIEAFTQNRDIHAETASWVFGVMPEFVTPEMRRAAKMINFGLLYGMSSFGLAERLDISRNEADGIMKRYFDALPNLQPFIDSLIHDAKERGYSRTLAGRIRPVKEIPAKGPALDRALINSPVQGTAADIARKAVTLFDATGAADLFLQVHDSLVCECPVNRAAEVSEILRKVMLDAGGEISFLSAETKIGKTLAGV